MQIKGISAAVPKNCLHAFDDVLIAQFGEETVKKITTNTGVMNRRIAVSNCCTSDLALVAARNLLDNLQVDPASIDACIFISQTPDYMIPSTSPIIQTKLNLPETCFTLDVNKGCTGFTDGLILAQSMFSGMGFKKVLLLTGDTLSRIVDPKDQGVSLLFGDAACATLLEPSEGPFFFSTGTDGKGSLAIHQKIGYRNTLNNHSPHSTCPDDIYLHLDGVDIFNFTIDRVPKMVKDVLEKSRWDAAAVDYFVFHQANRFILDYLIRKLRLPKEKTPMCLGDFGNTSSASIPLTIVSKLQNQVSTTSNKMVFIGFGVGLAWSAVAMDCPSFKVCPIIELEA